MKRKIYDGLVNKQVGICYRYHRVHDGAKGAKKLWSWAYLLLINFGFYVLFMKYLGELPQSKIYEEKKLKNPGQEGNCYSVDEFVAGLMGYEAISFDIFDTLIFRPFSEPTDLFFYVGNELGAMDFKNVRTQMEKKAREIEHAKSGSYEVSLEDIYEVMAERVGVAKQLGMEAEMEAELEFCYANPFMKQVFDRLIKAGKRVVITSDMYLSSEFLEKMLKNCGYEGYEKLFVSNEYKKNKYEGGLYQIVKEYLGIAADRIAHVGDNTRSDIDSAVRAGFKAVYYANVNKDSSKYRSYDMSAVIGGAYRGIVNNKYYCGLVDKNPEYEFGYIYGGLFVYGYCSFINRYCKEKGIEKILFLSRDGDILKKAYDIMYPGNASEYVYWSRKAATKLMADNNRLDYFRRFIDHKVNKNISVGSAVKSMGLECLADELFEKSFVNSELTNSNSGKVKDILVRNWDKVLAAYENEHKGAKEYYKKAFGGAKKVAAVDIGWAGSGAYALDYLSQKVWKLECSVVGIVAGTNTIHNVEPDCSETFLQSGRMVSYMYSQSHNRDLLKKHNLNKDYNVYWELLLSSPTKQFTGFGYDREIVLDFGRADDNQEGIVRIQEGILDFVRDYKRSFGGIDIFENISGRDAYAPMLLAAGKKEKYLKNINKRFNLDVNV